MKKLIISICLSVICVSSFSQPLTVSQNNILFSGDACAGFVNNLYVHNNSSATNLVWHKSVQSAPAGWTTSLCDNCNCYADSYMQDTCPVSNGDSDLIIFHINTSCICGQGVYYIDMYDPIDSVNTNLRLTYTVDAWGCAGITSINTAESISIFPNPVSEHLNILTEKNFKISWIQIFSISGTKVYSETISQEMPNYYITVQDFESGLYFIRVINKNGEAMYKSFFKK